MTSPPRFVEIVLQRVNAIPEELAGGGSYASVVPFEYSAVVFLFQTLNLAGECRLRNVQALNGCVDASQLQNNEEAPDVVYGERIQEEWQFRTWARLSLLCELCISVRVSPH